MVEIWSSFEKNYEISNKGNIRSIDRFVTRSDTGALVFYKGKLLKQAVNRYGYRTIMVSVENIKKSFNCHRLVAKAFIPNPDSLPEVNHKDGNKQNNNVYNLEWCTSSYNQLHANRTGLRIPLKEDKHHFFTGTVLAYDRLTHEIVAEMKGNLSMKSFGFDFRLVSACILGKRQSHKGCYFIKLDH